MFETGMLCIVLLLVGAAATLALSHSYTIQWDLGGTAQSTPLTTTPEQVIGGEFPVADGSTNQSLNIAFTLAKLTDFMIVSDRNVTIKTNSTSSPQETISLIANKPLLFVPGIGMAALFAGNVTAVYATNASGSAATIKVKIGVDHP